MSFYSLASWILQSFEEELTITIIRTADLGSCNIVQGGVCAVDE